MGSGIYPLVKLVSPERNETPAFLEGEQAFFMQGHTLEKIS
jgi:hypothetical protein